MNSDRITVLKLASKTKINKSTKTSEMVKEFYFVISVPELIKLNISYISVTLLLFFVYVLLLFLYSCSVCI
jgi:hypothetical protein